MAWALRSSSTKTARAVSCDMAILPVEALCKRIRPIRVPRRGRHGAMLAEGRLAGSEAAWIKRYGALLPFFRLVGVPGIADFLEIGKPPASPQRSHEAQGHAQRMAAET